MSDAIAIGRNIQIVRKEKGMTQRELYEATGISTSQLSSYENGKQMIGLVSLAKIAKALDTSIDRLYFGKPSEAFLNEAEDYGETVVNCFRKLKDLGIVSSVSHDSIATGGSAHLKTCTYELQRMFQTLRDFERHKEFYPNENDFLNQLYQSIANEINKRGKH